jgi:thiamine kinase-like enzyme
MVVTPEGQVVVIDNEGLRVGPLDYDLARCWSRWPMTGTQRQAFCDGYRQYRSLETFQAHRQFWAIRAMSQSLSVHLKHGKENPQALAALRCIAAGDDRQFWPTLPAAG